MAGHSRILILSQASGTMTRFVNVATDVVDRSNLLIDGPCSRRRCISAKNQRKKAYFVWGCGLESN